MSQSDAASQAAIDRLKREIELDKKRIATIIQPDAAAASPEECRVGRLYRVFEAMGQAT